MDGARTTGWGGDDVRIYLHRHRVIWQCSTLAVLFRTISIAPSALTIPPSNTYVRQIKILCFITKPYLCTNRYIDVNSLPSISKLGHLDLGVSSAFLARLDLF